jgi:hypothetical protein
VFASAINTPLEPRNVTRPLAADGCEAFEHPAARSTSFVRHAAPRARRQSARRAGDARPFVSLTLNTSSRVLPVLQRDAAARMNAVFIVTRQCVS